MTGRVAAALAVLATLIVPASASAKLGSVFDMTRASGTEQVKFEGDSAASCESYGVCGYSGTVTYSIGGEPRGTLVLARSRTGRISGGATYRTRAITRASVTPPDGAANCTDTVAHRSDLFSLTSLRSSAKTLLLSYDVSGDDILATSCPGPTKRDAARAGALPEGTFEASGFRGRRLRFGFSGALPFKGSGFSATSTWNLRYEASGRNCNPRCPIPAHRPR